MQQITICDNSISPDILSEQIIASLLPYAGVPLQELQSQDSDLLIFPHRPGGNHDGIEQQTLFDIAGGKFKSGNVMGFFCIDDISIAIHSRFDHTDEQFFMHYMLQKVFAVNILDLRTHLGQENLWEFLIYIFPYCLLRALRQGLFRAYQQFNYNDSKVKGAVDIARHLKQNLPFSGNIAYRMREYSTDNPMMQLIRHTIEFIKSSRSRASILSSSREIREAAAQIISATPSYNAHLREKVIFQNLRKNTHPYFTEYTFLQDLCLKILRHDKVSTGQDKHDIRGIVFDGAWLWEEYLATILKKLEFEHPENKTGKGVRYLFKNKTGKIFPDFIGKNSILDAKYKMLDKGTPPREDVFQIISYMHVLEKQNGFLVYPGSQTDQSVTRCELNGMGGWFGTIPLTIPPAASRNEFADLMKSSETNFAENILKYTS